MVDFPIDVGIRKIGDSILVPIQRDPSEEWFAEDITVLLSSSHHNDDPYPTVFFHTLH